MAARDEQLPADVAAELDALLERIRSGRTTGAAELQALLARAPDSLEIMGHLHWALAHEGRHEEAIAVCERYRALAPDNIEMRWRIADRLVNLERLDEALAAYRAILDEHPDCLDAKMGVRYVLYRQRVQARSDGDALAGAHPPAPAPPTASPYVPRLPPLTDRQRRNRELNLREFALGRLRLRSMPHRLYLECTTRCNFWCQTCSKGYGPYFAEDLRPAILDAVRRELLPVNTHLSITGFGEPTLAPDFDAILQMALENGSLTHFVTNASLLNFERLERLTRCPVNIVLSCDGASRETFEAIRAGADFDLFLDKLAMIKKLRDIHLSHVFSGFSFNFVAIRRNIAELPDVVRLARRFDITHVNVTDYALNDNAFDAQSLRFDAERANHFMRQAARVARELGVTLVLPPEFSPEARHPGTGAGLAAKIRTAGRLWPERRRFPQRCSSPWTEPYIQTNGVVVPCCSSRQFLGDLRRRPFAAVWNGWRYRLLRWRIDSPLPPIQCRLCYLPWGINAGNAGNVMAREGLMVKAWYWGEVRARRAGHSLKDWWRRTVRRERPPAPNYHRGRPLKNKAGAT
ncbi:MAG: hypothetical protein Kow0059_21170 [Candidatus Sumerlaeia bacterium]